MEGKTDLENLILESRDMDVSDVTTTDNEEDWLSSASDEPQTTVEKIKLPSRKRIEGWKKENEKFKTLLKSVRDLRSEWLAESSEASSPSGSSFDLSDLEWEDINYSQEKEVNAWTVEGPGGKIRKPLDEWVELGAERKKELKKEFEDAFKYLRKNRKNLTSSVKKDTDDKASVSTNFSDMMERSRTILELDKQGD